MKFTSEDLLKAMGLKIGDKIQIEEDVFEINISKKNKIRVFSLEFEGHSMALNEILGMNYTTLKPKPTLTEETKIVLKNLDKRIKWILFQEESLYGYDYEPTMVGNLGCYYISDTFDLDCIKHLLIDLKELTPYSIEELLKEKL